MKAVVTGAARGLGLGLVQVLTGRGDAVLATCRTVSPALRETGVQTVDGIDLSRPDSLRRLASTAGGEPIDLVICNAAINVSFDAGIDDLDLELVSHEFAVNALGPVRTVKALLPCLRSGSKVVLITTGRLALGPAPATPGNYGYRMSKAALNVFGFVMADELGARGIAVQVISPGPISTGLLSAVYETGRSSLDPADAPDPVEVARKVLARVDELTLAATGTWVEVGRASSVARAGSLTESSPAPPPGGHLE